MEDVYNDMLSTKPEELKEIPKKEPLKEKDSFIRVNFFISRDQQNKLKEYAKRIAPAHLKISQSELIRYMIENFDLRKAQQDFFTSNKF